MTSPTTSASAAALTISCQSSAAVFDCDGLLVDSGDAWVYAFARGAASAGCRLTREQRAALVGSSVETGARLISAWAGRPDDAARVSARINAALHKAIRRGSIRPLPGAAALLASLHGRLPLAVASNAPADVLTEMLAASGLRFAFEAVVSADEVASPKPAPDVYLRACSLLGVEPENAVAFEDSRTGALAAQSAGLSLVVVTRQPWPQQEPLVWPAQPRSLQFIETLEDLAVGAELVSAVPSGATL